MIIGAVPVLGFAAPFLAPLVAVLFSLAMLLLFFKFICCLRFPFFVSP